MNGDDWPPIKEQPDRSAADKLADNVTVPRRISSPEFEHGNHVFPIMVNERNEGTCLTRGLGVTFSYAKSATSLIYAYKMGQNSAFTPSGGRPMTAFTPFETIGRSIKMGLSTMDWTSFSADSSDFSANSL